MDVNPFKPPNEWHGIPNTLRITMIFIDRIGFPILAFIMSVGICYLIIVKMNDALKGLAESNMALRISIEEQRKAMMPVLERISRKLKAYDE